MVAAHPREAEFSESLTCSRLAVAGIMMPTQPTIIELDMNNLEDVLRRAEAKLDEKDYALLKALADSYACHLLIRVDLSRLRLPARQRSFTPAIKTCSIVRNCCGQSLIE